MGALISALAASLASVGALATTAGRSPSAPAAMAANSCPGYVVSACKRSGGRALKSTNAHLRARRSASNRSGSVIAGTGTCRVFRARGARFSVMVLQGRVRCGKARRVLRDFLSGRGQMHGPRSGPASEQAWTVDGWTCGYGTGGGACMRRGTTYTTPGAWIEAQQT
jgi:hypothetical protein